MIGWAFHAWERRLAAESRDVRVTRPFEWGEDWLPTAPECDARSPFERIGDWVDEVMEDTDAFFTPPRTSDYRFDSPSGGLDTEGTLEFPSAFTTPHLENNTVHAQWFPPRHMGPGGRAVLVMPQWNSDADGHVGLCRVLARAGIGALRLSLPYHDKRMPPELTRADYIVSSNVTRTVQVCRQAVLDARRALAWLHGAGIARLGILGTSLGSCLAMLTASHEPLVRAQALNHVSPFFADVVWRGLSTEHVRAGLDGFVTLDELRHLWRPISPWSYLERTRGTATLLVYARYDLTFPVDLSRLLVRGFEERGIETTVTAMPCGHYSIGKAPFKYLDAATLVRFLRRTL